MIEKYRSLACVMVFAGMVVLATGCGGSEKSTITIEYVLNPSVGLPPGMTSVAILDAKVNEVTDTKWSELAANYVQHLIQESNEKYGANLQVADRKHTSTVMKEADMAAAGMVASANPGATAKLLNVQGMVMVEINVKTRVDKGKGTTVSGVPGLGFSRYGLGSGANTKEVEKVSRHITVQTNFKLIDAATSRDWTTHTESHNQSDKTKISPFFGSSRTESSLTPRDEIIGAAVELGARGFVSKLIPCAVRYEVELKSSAQENCAQGIKMMRGDMFEEAMSQFKMALAENPEDHRAAFAAGVCSEALGNFDQALRYYKQASMGKNVAEYVVAKKRIAENKNRIRTR